MRITLSICPACTFEPSISTIYRTTARGTKTALVNSGEVCMIRVVLKVVLVVIVLVGLGAFLLGRWSGGGDVLPGTPGRAAGPGGTSKTREGGAESCGGPAKAGEKEG